MYHILHQVNRIKWSQLSWHLWFLQQSLFSTNVLACQSKCRFRRSVLNGLICLTDGNGRIDHVPPSLVVATVWSVLQGSVDGDTCGSKLRTLHSFSLLSLFPSTSCHFQCHKTRFCSRSSYLKHLRSVCFYPFFTLSPIMFACYSSGYKNVVESRQKSEGICAYRSRWHPEHPADDAPDINMTNTLALIYQTCVETGADLSGGGRHGAKGHRTCNLWNVGTWPNPASWWMWQQKTLGTDNFTLTLWFRGPAHRSQRLRGRKRPTLVLKEPGDWWQRREQRLSENVFDILSTVTKKTENICPDKKVKNAKKKQKRK